MATSMNFRGIEAGGGPAGNEGLELGPRQHAPGHLLQDLPEGDAHGQLIAAGLDDLAADAVELGAGPGLGPGQALEPGAAVSDQSGARRPGFRRC